MESGDYFTVSCALSSFLWFKMDYGGTGGHLAGFGRSLDRGDLLILIICNY